MYQYSLSLYVRQYTHPVSVSVCGRLSCDREYSYTVSLYSKMCSVCVCFDSCIGNYKDGSEGSINTTFYLCGRGMVR